MANPDRSHGMPDRRQSAGWRGLPAWRQRVRRRITRKHRPPRSGIGAQKRYRESPCGSDRDGRSTTAMPHAGGQVRMTRTTPSGSAATQRARIGTCRSESMEPSTRGFSVPNRGTRHSLHQPVSRGARCGICRTMRHRAHRFPQDSRRASASLTLACCPIHPPALRRARDPITVSAWRISRRRCPAAFGSFSDMEPSTRPHAP